MAYRIIYAIEAGAHLRALPARQRSIIIDNVDEQLSHDPLAQTRNRKKMRQNSIAPWELRIGRLRVYYDVCEEPEPTVSVVAVGIKVHNSVLIAGQVVRL